MTYKKPEIELLGTAVNVVQGPKPSTFGESPQADQPAYDLDEE